MPRDRLLLLAVGPDIVPTPMPQESPTKGPQLLLEVPPSHELRVHQTVYEARPHGNGLGPLEPDVSRRLLPAVAEIRCSDDALTGKEVRALEKRSGGARLSLGIERGAELEVSDEPGSVGESEIGSFPIATIAGAFPRQTRLISRQAREQDPRQLPGG
jgi:hypothetical protein